MVNLALFLVSFIGLLIIIILFPTSLQGDFSLKQLPVIVLSIVFLYSIIAGTRGYLRKKKEKGTEQRKAQLDEIENSLNKAEQVLDDLDEEFKKEG